MALRASLFDSKLGRRDSSAWLKWRVSHQKTCPSWLQEPQRSVFAFENGVPYALLKYSRVETLLVSTSRMCRKVALGFCCVDVGAADDIPQGRPQKSTAEHDCQMASGYMRSAMQRPPFRHRQAESCAKPLAVVPRPEAAQVPGIWLVGPVSAPALGPAELWLIGCREPGCSGRPGCRFAAEADRRSRLAREAAGAAPERGGDGA